MKLHLKVGRGILCEPNEWTYAQVDDVNFVNCKKCLRIIEKERKQELEFESKS